MVCKKILFLLLWPVKIVASTENLLNERLRAVKSFFFHFVSHCMLDLWGDQPNKKQLCWQHHQSLTMREDNERRERETKKTECNILIKPKNNFNHMVIVTFTRSVCRRVLVTHSQEEIKFKKNEFRLMEELPFPYIYRLHGHMKCRINCAKSERIANINHK